MSYVDTVVVGAGIAGIGAAEAATRARRSVLVFEKGSVGGHVVTTFIDGRVADAGFIFGDATYTDVLRKVREFGLRTAAHTVRLSVVRDGVTRFRNTARPGGTLGREVDRFVALTRVLQPWWWCITFDTFLRWYAFGDEFREDVVLPLLSALFITRGSLRKPAYVVAYALTTWVPVSACAAAHPLWTCVEGNISIINNIVRASKIEVVHEEVVDVRRDGDVWVVRSPMRHIACATVIFACGPTEASRVLAMPTLLQRAVLAWGRSTMEPCYGTLHLWDGIGCDEGYLYDADRSILTGNIGRQRGTRDVYLSIGEREDDRIPSSSIVRRFVWEHPRQGFLTMVLTCVGVTRLMEGNGCRFCGAWTTVLNHNNCYLSGKHAAERRYDVLRLRACATCTLGLVALWWTTRALQWGLA